MAENKKQSEFEPNSIDLIAHKIRTPLTVIMSTVNNLTDGAFGKLSTEQIHWLKKLTLHTIQLETLLDRLFKIVQEDDKAEHILEVLEKGDFPSKVHPRLAPSAFNENETGRPKKILIVDDEPDILEVLQESLSSKGF